MECQLGEMYVGMIWNHHFRIFVGDPIPVSELQRYGGLREQAEFVRKKAYFLENMLAPEPEKR